MKKNGFIAIALATILLIFTNSFALAASSSYNTNGNFGIALGDISNNTNAKLKNEFADISKMGFTWIRTDFNWSHIQPNNSQAYSWATYDQVTALATQYHLHVLGILDYAPRWASQSNCLRQANCAPKDATQFATFAATVALRYKQSVQTWEIWNEENTLNFWGVQPDAADYTQLLKSSYPAIKNANPNAFVISGGLAPDNVSATSMDPVTYLQQMYEAGAGNYFDALGYHPYTYPSNPFLSNTGWSKMESSTPSLRSVMEANGDSKKQIWLTEYGAPTNGPANSNYVGETTQAQMALYAYIALQGKKWAGPLFWYTYQDAGTDTITKENFFGLKRADGSKKLSYEIWEQLLSQ